MRSLRALALSALLASAATPGVARAQDADPLVAAERAYGAVDFETQRAEAERALEAGGSNPARLARIYRLLGIAHAALGAPEQAKLAFMRLLAIDPDVELEHVLSPRLRTPYMEARGYWDVASTPLGVDVERQVAGGALELTLHDPLGMVTRVQVRSGSGEPQIVWEGDAAPQLSVPAAALAEFTHVALAVRLLDRHENVVVVRAIAAKAAAPAPPAAVSAPPAIVRAEPERPSLVLPLMLAGGSLIAFGVGATAHVARERHADEWNGEGCERPGLGTRAEQCADVDASRRDAERVAIAAYAAGGALLAGSVVTYLLSGAPRREAPTRATLACAGGPTPLGISCSARF
jgi:hypothetical protein